MWGRWYNVRYRELTFGNLDCDPSVVHQQAKAYADSHFALWFWEV